jgi:hypothetical protein
MLITPIAAEDEERRYTLTPTPLPIDCLDVMGPTT